MKMTRIITAGLCFLSLFAKSEPLYWQATKGDTTFMLLGSIHLGNESMYPLPEPVMQFLSHSNGLIVEANLSENSGIRYPATKITTKDILSTTQQNRLSELAGQVGIDVERLYPSAPWATAISLQVAQIKQLGYQSELGIDQYLIHQAQTGDIPVFGLETFQSQIDILADLDRSGADLLISTLDAWDETAQSVSCLFESWVKGDKAALKAITEESEIPDEVAERLAAERNRKWVEKLTGDAFLPNPHGKYLVVVGTLHLIGEVNILNLLEQHGYRIKQLSHSVKAECPVR